MNKAISKKELKQLKLTNELQIFNLNSQYEEVKSNPKFVSFNQLSASVLLALGLGFNSEAYKSFIELVNQAIVQKHNLVFNNFIISYAIDPKFSLQTISPVLVTQEPTTSESLNLRISNTSSQLSSFLQRFNYELFKLIEMGSYVELIPSIVVYISPETKTYKLFFNHEMLARIEK